MKKMFVILTLSTVCFSAQAVSRQINQSWNIARTPLTPFNVWFLQAESIEFNLTCLLGETPYPLTNANTTVVWELSQGENYTNLMAVGTGTVISATGGVVRLTLTPEQSNLTNGTYNGYVIARDVVDGITNRLVLARQNIVVGWSPYGLEYAYVGVSSPFYTIGAVDALLAPIYAMTGTWDAVTNKAEQVDFVSVSNRISSLETFTNSAFVSVSNRVGALESQGFTNINFVSVSNRTVSLEAYTAGITSISGRVVTLENYTVGIANISGRVVSVESRTNTWNAVTNKASQSDLNIVSGMVASVSAGAVTNVSVLSPNDVTISSAVQSTTSFSVSGFGTAAANGIYTNMNGLSGYSAIYTNAATGFYVAISGTTYWEIHHGNSSLQYRVYNSANVADFPPNETNTWFTMSGSEPIGILSAASTTGVAARLSTLIYGKTTNFIFMSSGVITGRLWFASGILTNLDLNIGD